MRYIAQNLGCVPQSSQAALRACRPRERGVGRDNLLRRPRAPNRRCRGNTCARRIPALRATLEDVARMAGVSLAFVRIIPRCLLKSLFKKPVVVAPAFNSDFPKPSYCQSVIGNHGNPI